MERQTKNLDSYPTNRRRIDIHANLGELPNGETNMQIAERWFQPTTSCQIKFWYHVEQQIFLQV